MRVEANTTSTHGYMINLHTILLSFATPFMDSQYSKVTSTVLEACQRY
jgi:ubiquitin conjugation factor E4 B